jgi:hypothetical protein
MESRRTNIGKNVIGRNCVETKRKETVGGICMRKKKEKGRQRYVAGDRKKRRLRSLVKVCVALLLPTLYLGLSSKVCKLIYFFIGGLS